jgi:hypothetical protein
VKENFQQSLSFFRVYLITCSEDGAIRIWGRQPTDQQCDEEGKELMAMTPIMRFTGLSDPELLQVNEDNPWSPQLLGECLGHAGTVHVNNIILV